MASFRTLAVTLCGILAIASSNASNAMIPTGTVLTAGLFPVHTLQLPSRVQPWWTGFEDATMSRLAAGSCAGPEAGLASAYVALKVKTLELLYAEKTRTAVARQIALIGGRELPHDDFARELATRQVRAEESITKLNALRTSYLGYLAAQCRMSMDALNELLAEALEDRALPRFAAPVPDEVPAVLLLERADINLSATLYGVDPREMLDGSIGPEEEMQDIAALGNPLYVRAVVQARQQVSAALRRLRVQSGIANAAYMRVVNAKAEFESSKRSHARAEISEVQLMEDFQSLLLDLNVLGAANGELALAWIVLMGSIGNGASIEANPSSQTVQSPLLHKVSRKLRNP